MSTFVPFTPGTVIAFSFSLTLGGVPYIATIPWSQYAQRYYLQLADQSGNIILYRGLVASGPRYPSSFTWANGTVVATTSVLHWVPVGQCANIRVTDTNTTMDGNFTVLATGPMSLAYSLAQPPTVPLPQSGTVNFDINLVAGLTLADRTPVGGFLLYHFETQQFEFEDAPGG